MDTWIVATAIFILAVAAILLWFYLRVKRLAPAVVETVAELIPESHFVTLSDGTKIHYLQAGTGADVVLLHGIGASVFVWRFLFPLLQGRYRVTAIDLPGFGQSSKEARRNYGLDAQSQVVAAALTAIGVNKAFLVGSSMGGTIALWMAKLFPDRFEHVAALAPATNSLVVPAQVRYFGLAAPLLKHAINRRMMKQLVSRVVTRQTLVTDEVVNEYMKPFLADQGSGVRSFWSAMALLADRRLPKELADVQARVLVIHGTRDLLVTRRSIDHLMKIMPKATLLAHEEGGHHIMEDEPSWTAQTLEEFIAAAGKI